MLYALLAGLIGAVFIGITSAIPLVNLMNVCCGAWVVMGGTLSAFLWTRFSGGRSSFFYGLLSGLLAGLIFAVGSLGSTGAWVSVSAPQWGKAMASLPAIKQLPTEPLTAEQMLDLAEQMNQENETDPQKKALNQTKIDEMRTKLVTARATPEQNDQIVWTEGLLNGFIEGLKAGDLSSLVNYLLMLFACIGALLVMLSTVGGFMGGLMFGSDGPVPAPAPQG